MTRFLSLFAVAVLALLPLAKADDWMPLVKGNYWVYRGPTKWAEGGEVKSAVLTCRMEITDVVRHGEIVAAVLCGHPSDLAWYGIGGRLPGKYLIVRVGVDTYYLFSGDRVEQTLQAIRAGIAPAPDGWLAGGELWLDAPLKVGKDFGGEPGNTQPHRYCWYVEGQEPFAGKNIAGLPRAKRTAFRLGYHTNPDHTYVGIVRGVGIVSYQYSHHGTVSETDLQIVGSHLKPEPTN